MIAHAEPMGFVHSALLYGSDREYVDRVGSFVREGLDLSEPALVAVPAPRLALLDDALGDNRDVTLVDIYTAGRNPRRILGLEASFSAQHHGRRVRMVGEAMWPGRSGAEYPGCVKYEALVNQLLADTDGSALCLFDARHLPDAVLADAYLTHSLIHRGGITERSASYAPDTALRRYNVPLPSSATAVRCNVQELAQLRQARQFVAQYARRAGLSSERTTDLQLIATELATNSLQHTGSGCRLALWQHDGHLVCEVVDNGRLDDPLAGYRPPRPGSGSGRGLFLVNTLADLVRVYLGDDHTTIQAYLRLDPLIDAGR